MRAGQEPVIWVRFFGALAWLLLFSSPELVGVTSSRDQAGRHTEEADLGLEKA